MNNKRKLTLILAAISGFATASESVSHIYDKNIGVIACNISLFDRISNVAHGAYQACNKDTMQAFGSVIAAKALEVKDVVNAKADVVGAACTAAYQACNKDNAQAALRYLEGQAKEHRVIVGTAIYFITFYGLYKLHSVYQELTAIEKTVVGIVENNSDRSSRDIRLIVAQKLDFNNQSVEVQYEILDALDKFVK